MTEEQFKEKFFSCMDKAAFPKNHKQQEDIFANANELEKIPDMRDLAEML